MTLADVLATLERRAQTAEAEGATAPVAKVYRLVLAELAPLAPNGNAVHAPQPEDRLLTVPEVARRLGVSPRWLYVHADDFPFTVRLPGRRLRFRAAALAHYLVRPR